MTPEANTDTATVEELVLETLGELAGNPDAVSAGATLEQIDVDSLDLAELGQVIEERFGVAIKGSDVAGIKTVGDAIAVIAAKVG